MNVIPSHCPRCGKATEITWSCSDNCDSTMWGPVQLSAEQANNLTRERDALLAAALDAIPFIRRAIEAAVHVRGFNPDVHPVLKGLIEATSGLQPSLPAAATGKGVAG